MWVDTAADPSILKIRNADNDAWITIGQIDQTGDKFNLTCANATISENLTLNAQGDLRFADSDSSNWVAFQAPATVASNVTWTLPSADGTSGQALTTDGAGTLSWAAGAPDSGYNFRNRIINGDMRIDQRNAGAAVSAATNTNPYTVDRWSFFGDPAGKVTLQQNQGSVTPPAGFVNYMGLTSSSAYSPAAGDAFRFQQIIEGLNISDLGWGTANAKTVTVSFWVRSSLTGLFGGALSNDGLNRSYPFSFSISSADTWEYKTVTIPGDTSGTWLTTNGIGIRLFFDVGCGTNTKGTAGAWAGAFYAGVTGGTNVVATNNATFQFTGVQLEVGSVATPFERRPYGAELALCQRYALKYNTDAIVYAFIGAGYATSTTNANISLPLPVQMRTAPTATASNLMVQDGTTITAVTATAVVTNQTNSLNAFVQATVASGLTAFRPYQLQTNNNTAGYLLLSAEL
jgi:hypothetical protein